MSNHLGDTNKMVSGNPRMDASAHDDGAIWQTGCELELELNAATSEIEEKRKDVVWLATEKAKLEERIKRLEEAGDRMVNEGWNEPHLANAWRKAKEAKL
jgi:hypothetical protein